jgi:antitoxin component of MazEF toxin-antitoxin module
MEKIKVLARKWGDSIAVILPSDVVKKEGIAPLDNIIVGVEREDDISDFFGKLKTEKTAQELKDESRKGWE